MSQSGQRLAVSTTETVSRPTQLDVLENLYHSVMKMDSIYHSSVIFPLDIVGVWKVVDRKEQEPGLDLVSHL